MRGLHGSPVAEMLQKEDPQLSLKCFFCCPHSFICTGCNGWPFEVNIPSASCHRHSRCCARHGLCARASLIGAAFSKGETKLRDAAEPCSESSVGAVFKQEQPRRGEGVPASQSCSREELPPSGND